MEFIKDVQCALENRKSKIKFIITKKNYTNKQFSMDFLDLKFPLPIINFYTQIESLKIIEPKYFEIIDLMHFELIDNKYLLFSIVSDEKICFDISNTNSAGEWNIICLSNNFLITKTFSSYLTNKIWAWVDRGREIWKEEFYNNI